MGKQIASWATGHASFGKQNSVQFPVWLSILGHMPYAPSSRSCFSLPSDREEEPSDLG